MGYDDDPGMRVAARLAALAMARACTETLAGGEMNLDGALAAGLFLAGRPGAGHGRMPDVPDAVTWLLGAQAQVCAVALYEVAAARAGRAPTPDEVAAVCDELETGLLAPHATPG